MVRASATRPGGNRLRLIEALGAAIGPEHVVTDPDIKAGQEIDWTGKFRGRALAVVRPGTTAEVAAVLRACHRTTTPVVPQGGNTGLVGGSVPDDSGRAVVLSTARLNQRGPVDVTTAQVTLGAGVTLGQAQRHAQAAGFDVAVDLSARDTATIGGMAATNAGGIRVLRHGTMRRQVVGFEAVLADGAVLSHLAGLEKDNTGYDLGGLLCGSEGTLAVLTALRLRLVPVLPYRVTALLAWSDLSTMIDGLVRLRESVTGLDAAEYMTGAGVELVERTFDVPDAFRRPYPWYLIVEVGATTDPTALLGGVVEGLSGVLDVAVAAGTQQRHALWRLRDLHTEAVAAAGTPRKYDVTLPTGGVPAFLDAAMRVLADRRLECFHWGHLGDGNIHLNVLGVETADDSQLDGVVLGLVASHGGSISAEHGSGRLKRPWLHLSRSSTEVAAMRALKSAFDPLGLLNPGVLLP